MVDLSAGLRAGLLAALKVDWMVVQMADWTVGWKAD